MNIVRVATIPWEDRVNVDNWPSRAGMYYNNPKTQLCIRLIDYGLGSTEPVFMPDGFGIGSRGFTNFIFATPVPVISGTTYYFQPVIQSGDTNAFAIAAYNYNYSGGTAFGGGEASSFFDLWFREGTFVPEPSATMLLLGGLALLGCRACRRS